MRDRRKLIVAGAAALGLLALQHPSADIRILTHDLSDPAPRRMQAAVDLGLVGLSVLITWTSARLAR